MPPGPWSAIRKCTGLPPKPDKAAPNARPAYPRRLARINLIDCGSEFACGMKWSISAPNATAQNKAPSKGFQVSLRTAEILRRPRSLAYLQALKWKAQVKERVR